MDANKLLQNKYKEVNPMETVQKIRGILTGMGLDYKEVVENSGVGTYWAQLFVYLKGVHVSGSGGKGNTEEFALASAYAEMIEGLQTDLLRVNGQFYGYYNKEEMGYEEFITYPDEKQETDKEYHIKNYELFNYLRDNTTDKPYHHVLEKFIEQHVTAVHNSYGYVPLSKYTNYATGDTGYLDELFIRFILGSTGLSSGNTLKESLIQGLCEIVERHVKHEVYHKNLCFPLIPYENLTDYAKYVCRSIVNTGRYDIEIRDASLGKGLPAICAILYDRRRRGYVVSYGVFPVLDIAVDRTINELVQFYNVEDIKSVIEFQSYEPSNYIHEGAYFTGGINFEPKLCHDVHNLMGTNRYNYGLYKDRFFGTKYDYEFVPWEINQLKSNEELFEDLSELVIKELNTEIFYKEYSFLDFCSTSIICPQLVGRQFVELDVLYPMMMQDRGCVEKFIYGGLEDPQNFIREYESMYKKSNLNVMLGRPLKYEGSSIEILDGYVEFVKGNYEESSRMIMKNNMKLGTLRQTDIITCLYNYIGMMSSIEDDEEIRKILGRFYTRDIVNMISEACKDYKTLAHALFIDRSNELNMVEWEMYEASKDVSRIILNKKKNILNYKE